jgi:hypothetical protein
MANFSYGPWDFQVANANGQFVKVGTITIAGSISGNSITSASWFFIPTGMSQQGPWGLTATFNPSNQNYSLASNMNPAMTIPSQAGSFSSMAATMTLDNNNNLTSVIGSVGGMPPLSWQASPTFGPWEFDVQNPAGKFVQVGMMWINADVAASGQSISNAVWSFTATNGSQQGPWPMIATFNAPSSNFALTSSMNPALDIPPGLADGGEYGTLSGSLALNSNALPSGNITTTDSVGVGGTGVEDVAWEASSPGEGLPMGTKTAYGS